MNGFGPVSLFWIVVFLFIVVALAFVSPPLLRRRVRSCAVDREAVNVAIYRDQLRELAADLQRGELAEDQYRGAVLELEKRLSEDVPPRAAAARPADSGRWAGFVLAGAVPLLALGLYAMLGSPEAIAPAQAADGSSRGGGAGAARGEHDPSAMIAALEARLKDKPDDASGWHMLGHAYGALGRFDGAAGALAEASRLLPDDSRLLADYAEALALAQGHKIDGKPMALLARALEINDKEEKALELLGVAAYQNKNFAQAAFYWRQ
ncbi:MAG: c-type cytochrome biogenesis protein CcmI, partial [Betaproteobacteria bacterium]|nr:c-type cytochrome biogenesis protein CcmI [Betaproteobacteria bacterium]